MTTARQPRVVLVPTQCAIVFDRRGWSILPAPPQWWLDEQEAAHERDARPRGALSLVATLSRPSTACRPGSGPCRRRHEHVSLRRSLAS